MIESATIIVITLLRELWDIFSQSIRQPTKQTIIEMGIEDHPISGIIVQESKKRIYTRDAAPKRQRVVVVNPTFKMIFISILVITAVAGVAQIAMATVWDHPTSSQASVFEAMGFAWKTGIGAIFGLLGGKTA